MRNKKEIETLIQKHIGLAKSLARKHRQYETSDRPDYEERESTAMLALVEAAHQHDPNKSTFSTYASKVIKSELIRADRRHVFPVKVSDNTHRIIRDIRRAVNNGTPETPEAVSDALDINIKKINEIWKYYKKEVIAQPNEEEEEKGASIAETIPSEAHLENDVIEKIQQEQVRKAVNKLPEKHRTIIQMRFGFETGEPMLSSEVMKSLGIKEAEYKAAEAAAIKKLGQLLQKEKPADI